MSHLLVAAIDFGTTYSGWAFSFKHDFDRDPIKISAKNWTGGQLVSQKGPTCVLIEPNGQTLHSFGYDAENKYVQLAADDKAHTKWYFFKRFKMMLFDKLGIERNILLEDSTGKKLPAKTVFSLSIKYLKDDLIKTSEKTIVDGGLSDNDIYWVLTVPAIWNDAAKQFMREAAENAGIPGNKLTIALEPEGASIFCRYLPVEKCLGRDKTSLSKFKKGTKYIVLDAGGGTVDITVHEVVSDKELRELNRASGGAWGGTKVDDAFETFLGDLLGKEVIVKFKDQHMEDYIDLFRDFEIKKRTISHSNDDKITIRFPLALFELVSEMTGHSIKDCALQSRYKNKLNVSGDKIRFEVDVMRSFFESTVTSIVDHVATLLKKPAVSDCKAIVMVGGFSESPMLQENIQKTFSKLKVVIPDEAGLAVMKGAVIFGHRPMTIVERICRYTYGQYGSHKTSPNCNHPTGLQTLDENGEMRCWNMFEIHAKLGQAVKIGEETPEQVFTPICDDQTLIDCDIFASTNPNPTFVTEIGCKKIGTLIIPIYDTSLGRNREFGSTFRFGGTEIEVKIVDKATGEAVTKTVDFLG